jgi:hypothetical protein
MTHENGEPIGDWGEYQRLVLKELIRLDASIEKLSNKIDEVRNTDIKDMSEEIQVLKFKAGLWGALAGMIPVLISLGLYVLFKK